MNDSKVSMATKPGGYPPDIENPDDWARFLARYLDNRATNAVHNGIGLVALHIADAISEERRRLQKIKSRIDMRMNDHLCGMKPDYDDTITGFNEAWDIARDTFAEAINGK